MTKHSEAFYFKARDSIYDRLDQLPKGTLKKRVISGRTYYYLQRREGKKVIHDYIGPEISKSFKKQLEERKILNKKLADIQSVLMSLLSDTIRNIR